MNTNKNDLLVILPLIFLLGLGLVMVSSSSIYVADDMKSDPFYFAERQFIFIAIGLIAMLFFLVIPSELLYKSDWIFLLVDSFYARVLKNQVRFISRLKLNYAISIML